MLSLLVEGASCFSPGYGDCQLRCGTSGECPEGMTCLSGYCRSDPAPRVSCEDTPEPPAVSSDAAVPPPPPATCDETRPVEQHECGGPVVCSERITAKTVKARVIYAKDVEALTLEAVCLLESEDEEAWAPGNHRKEIKAVSVEADVIYAKEIRADRVEAEEIRAREMHVGP